MGAGAYSFGACQSVSPFLDLWETLLEPVIYCMKPCKMKVPNWPLFSVCVLYFPLENIIPEILLCIRCHKSVKVPLTLMHYGKYCT